MKKVLSLVLALALVLAIAVPSFASTDNTLSAGGASASNVTTGTPEIPTINVTVPTTASFVINPYKMDVLPEGGTAGTDEVSDTVISTNQVITNTSNIGLNIGVTITGKGGSGVTFVDSITDATKTNSVALEFIYKVLGDAADADTVKTTGAAEDLSAETTKAKVTAKATPIENGIALAAPAAGKANGIAFVIAGDVVTAPTKPWTASMTATVTTVFTITPVANS